MDKTVILAVAGAGKTYKLCNTVNPDRKNLIIAYTHQNISNIKTELIKRYGRVPELTTVMTFHSFVYQCFLCPYEPLVLKKLSVPEFSRNGITTRVPPTPTLTINGTRARNPKYSPVTSHGHYVFGNDYYCCYMSKLIVKMNYEINGLIQRVMCGINRFFDDIFVDEFQDFREYDYELLKSIIDYCNNIVLVGDYFQHSVNAQNNSGKPFSTSGEPLSLYEYIEELKALGLEVDCETLQKTRRCPKQICEFVEGKLGIEIDADNSNTGEVRIVYDDDEIRSILNDFSIVKLVFREAKKYSFNAVNWGYSKGDTYTNACVILTETFSNIDDETFNVSSVSDITRNKLYVALTRTAGNLFLIHKKFFDQVKDLYTIN